MSPGHPPGQSHWHLSRVEPPEEKKEPPGVAPQHGNCSALGTQRHKHPQDEDGKSLDACCQLGGKLEKKFPVTKKQTRSLRIRVEAFPLEKVWLCFQFSSVQSLSRVRLCNPMNCSTPGLPVHHQLPEFT